MKKWEPWMKRLNTLFAGTATMQKLAGCDLPLELSARFSYAIVNCNGQRFLAAMDDAGDTPLHYRHYRDMLKLHLKLPVVFFIRRIAAYQYGRLVNAQVPFITHGGYVYLPELLIHLSPEKQLPSRPPRKQDNLSPAAQVLLLRHLLFHDVDGHSMRNVAIKLRPYVAMSVCNAKNELESKGLCLYDGSATRGQLTFTDDDSTLWEAAVPFLRSPVQNRRYIRTRASLQGLTLAGESALSQITLLGEPMLPTYAIGKSALRDFFSHNDVEEVDEESASAVIEHWRYHPSLLMQEGLNCVDYLSLYLSLRDSADDRVLQELHKLPLP